MNSKNIKIIFILIALMAGGITAYLDIGNIIYIWMVSIVLLAILIARVSYRNKNYLGMFFTSFKAAGYELTKTEKDIGVIILVFMASPSIFMLILGLYGKIAL